MIIRVWMDPYIKNKSDNFKTKYNWFSKIKNIFNTRIKFIRSDNG